jgi:hypothetical protein
MEEFKKMVAYFNKKYKNKQQPGKMSHGKKTGGKLNSSAKLQRSGKKSQK